MIPSLKITDHGLVDVDRFELVPSRPLWRSRRPGSRLGRERDLSPSVERGTAECEAPDRVLSEPRLTHAASGSRAKGIPSGDPFLLRHTNQRTVICCTIFAGCSEQNRR